MEGSGRQGTEPKEGRGGGGGDGGRLVTPSLSDVERDHNASPLFISPLFPSLSLSLYLSFSTSVKVNSKGSTLDRSCPCGRVQYVGRFL